MKAKHQSTHALLSSNSTIADGDTIRTVVNVSFKSLSENNAKLIDKLSLQTVIEGYRGVVRESGIY